MALRINRYTANDPSFVDLVGLSLNEAIGRLREWNYEQYSDSVGYNSLRKVGFFFGPSDRVDLICQNVSLDSHNWSVLDVFPYSLIVSPKNPTPKQWK